MNRRNIADEWKLENSGENQEQWKLQPAEQNAISQWQLQEQARAAANEWRPVDYTRERQGGGNWILPTLVGVALVAVVTYVAWIVLQRSGALPDTLADATATSEVGLAPDATVSAEATSDVAAVATDTPQPTPTVEPTATTPPLPSPTPVPMVEMQSIVVRTAGGVNARRTPAIDGELVQIILPGDTQYLIAGEEGDWVQLALPDQQLVWVANEFVERVTETMTAEQANQQRAAVGLAPLVEAVSSNVISGTALLSGTVALSSTASLTTPTAAPATAISVTVNITDGLNSRETPALDGAVVQLLPNGTIVRARARTADNAWVQVQLADNRLAWVATQFVTPSGDLTTLSTTPATTAVGSTTPVTATNTLTTTPGVTGTQPSSVTQVVDDVTASVTDLRGANARPTPDRNAESLQILSFDAVLPVVGRSADSEWLQVALEEGQLAWVLVSAVTVNTDVANLPVVTP